jgi:hypothetical protein
MAALLAVLAGIYLPWTWSDELASLGGDSAVYVMSARHYAPYVAPDVVIEQVADASPYPPLYPLLLAVTGGAVDLRLAHLATTLCLLAAFAGMYAWLIGVGLPRGLSVATVAVFALMPGTLQQAFQLHSESLYLALGMAALATLARAERGAPQSGLWLAAGLIAAATLTRIAGIALLAALLWPALLRRSRSWGFALVAAGIPVMVWQLSRGSREVYAQGLLSHYAGLDPAQAVATLLRNMHAFAGGVADNLVQLASLAPIGLVLLLTGIFVGTGRLVRGKADAAYAYAYGGLMIVWPYPAEAQRFAWVLVPLVIGYAMLGGQWLAARLPDRSATLRRVLPWALLLVPGVPIASTFALAVERALHPVTRELPAVRHLPEWYAIDREGALQSAQFHLAVAASIRSLGEAVPADECIFSIKTPIVAYYTQHISKSPPGVQFDDAAFAAELERKGCRYFLLLGFASPAYPEPYYPSRRLRDRLEMLDSRVLRIGDYETVVAILARLRQEQR